MLRARERAPIPSPSVIFTFRFTIESIKELGGALDLITNVQCNGLMLHEVLVDGRVRVNVMTIIVMKYLRLKIDRLTLLTLKMINK